MAKDNKIKFYDLALASGATISPFVWATKYAIAHKGFELDIVPGGFSGIPERTGGVTERRGHARIGHRDDNVGFNWGFTGKLTAKLFARLVDAPAID